MPKTVILKHQDKGNKMIWEMKRERKINNKRRYHKTIKWCGWRDLNPHDSRHQNLNLACLPISPQPQLKLFYTMLD